MATPQDLALMIEPTFYNESATFRGGTAEEIVRRFGMRYEHASVKLPELGGDRWAHQMTTFVGLANMMVARYPQITEVWCGRNSAEPSEGIRGFIEQNMAAWAILNPNVPFLHPSEHLTKRQHWELIPPDIRPLVSSCVHHRMCGTCDKCKEWLCLSENSPSGT